VSIWLLHWPNAAWISNGISPFRRASVVGQNGTMSRKPQNNWEMNRPEELSEILLHKLKEIKNI
jgi:catalase (peroxidase I)